MKKLKMILAKSFNRGTRYATLSDIQGRKSGGVRDANKVDWYVSDHRGTGHH